MVQHMQMSSHSLSNVQILCVAQKGINIQKERVGFSHGAENRGGNVTVATTVAILAVPTTMVTPPPRSTLLRIWAHTGSVA